MALVFVIHDFHASFLNFNNLALDVLTNGPKYGFVVLIFFSFLFFRSHILMTHNYMINAFLRYFEVAKKLLLFSTVYPHLCHIAFKC